MRHGNPDLNRREYLFIDAGYLRQRINEFATTFFNEEHYGWDCQAIAGPFLKTFFYDCPPDEKNAHVLPQYGDLITATKRLPGVHVVLGVLTSGKNKRQKQVDVKLAVDMLSHTLNRTMEAATLLAGDQDFVPVLEALVRAGMYVSLTYAPSSISPALLDAADSIDEMSYHDLYLCCSKDFKKSHRLVTREGFAHQTVEAHFNRESVAADRWQQIGSGKTEEGATARVAVISPANQFAVFVDRGDGHFERFMHPDPHILCRQVQALGFKFTVSKITREYRDRFPVDIQTALAPAPDARPADAG